MLTYLLICNSAASTDGLRSAQTVHQTRSKNLLLLR